MISLVLYGRNDAHGYNLHRRAATSLNCLAEVLTDPDDEILFVDYNTPDELPTFVESLADTFTARCRERIRVFRVPAALHRERFGALTHLPTVEAVARNAAVRRANPENRWLLFTNSDMIVFPLAGDSLSVICRDLANGFYGLPRFEVPEWLWEQFPRSDPTRVISELRRLGPGLRLDEHTLSDRWIHFEAPGDFQLCRRDDFVAIDGFDEEMLLGWHVDSNLSRRMALHGRSVEGLDDRLAGYHCNHSRIPTVYHEAVGIANDLERFFIGVERAQLPDQRATWGLVDVALEELSVDGRAGRRLADALVAEISELDTPRIVSSAQEWTYALTYDSGHVLPFLADAIAVSPTGSTLGYVGANPTLERMLVELLPGLDRSLTLLSAADETSAADVESAADVLIVDFGLDSASAGSLDRYGSGPYPPSLRGVLTAFRNLVDSEREHLDRGAHPRRFVLVNSSTVYTDAYVTAQLDCSYTTPHSRLRRATVKLVPAQGDGTETALVQAERLLSWGERSDLPTEPLRLRARDRVKIAEVANFTAFGDGWLYPEATAIWTRGVRSELAFALDVPRSGPHLFTIMISRVGAARDESLEVDLLIDGVRVETRLFPGGAHASAWRVRLPHGAVARGAFDMQMDIREPRVWLQDDRQLGLYVSGFVLERDGWRRRLRDGGRWLRQSRYRTHRSSR